MIPSHTMFGSKVLKWSTGRHERPRKKCTIMNVASVRATTNCTISVHIRVQYSSGHEPPCKGEKTRCFQQHNTTYLFSLTVASISVSSAVLHHRLTFIPVKLYSSNIVCSCMLQAFNGASSTTIVTHSHVYFIFLK